MRTATLQMSPYAAPFASELARWLKRLETLRHLLEGWAAFQALWMHLEPLFRCLPPIMPSSHHVCLPSCLPPIMPASRHACSSIALHAALF